MYDEEHCPECESTNIRGHFDREGADADGNRGIIVLWYACNDCLTEWYV